jgi:hypothetical protein
MIASIFFWSPEARQHERFGKNYQINDSDCLALNFAQDRQ